MKRGKLGLGCKLIFLAIGCIVISLRLSTEAMAQEVDSLLPEPSKNEIVEKWNQWIKASSDKENENPFITEPSGQAPYREGTVNANYLKKGLDAANFYRFISGLPADLELDSALNEQAQFGAILLAANGRLSHYPSQPADMPANIYKRGKESTSSSNIFTSYRTQENIFFKSVRYYMDDSDVSNIDRLGHRRWILNPALQKVGFGLAFKTEKDGLKVYYSPMQVFDKSRLGLGYNYILYPNKGGFPLEAFRSQQAWSVLLNPSVFQQPSSSEVEVELTRQSDQKKWVFNQNMQNEEFPLSYSNVDPNNLAWHQQAYFNVETTSYGYNHAIIFRPDLLSPLHNGDQFKVHITGLKKLDGTSAEISYQTSFFSITGAPDEKLTQLIADKTALKVRAGETVQLPKIEAHYDGGTNFDASSKVSLTSNSNSIRIENHAITGIKKGKSTVSASFEGKTILIEVEVYEAAQLADVQLHWARDAIQWAINKRIASGYPDGTFKPNQQVSEAEFLSMLFTLYADSKAMQGINASEAAKKMPDNSWDDKFYWYAEYLNLDMHKSMTDRNYRKHVITRSEVAQIVASLGGKYFTNDDDAIQYLLVMGYTTGKTGATVEGYAGKDPLTRAEAIVFLKNLSEHDYYITGRPNQTTSLTENERKGYLEDLTIKAKFSENHTLQLTGNLSEMANKTVSIKIHGPSPLVKYIQTETAQVDSDGNFTLKTDQIDAPALSIYVYIRDDYSYFIDVGLGKETINSYAYTKLLN
ncbi:S-layer homology domain-containing protein [Paenibacillus sp.]|jgi:uncharacterized protein YkwD|uniref:S-layer homology domain-containing protein n=1 Tax=Paenibacillus sp. TaxID=58172 RepID=UPI00281D61A9|nr:S-layer homology domain-containing protein [Paenibacillus sp.]MDR0267950.1 S-layer homology domain-containing protein [Paenibacillus sp.]